MAPHSPGERRGQPVEEKEMGGEEEEEEEEEAMKKRTEGEEVGRIRQEE